MDGDEDLGQDILLAVYGATDTATFADIEDWLKSLGFGHLPDQQGAVGTNPWFTGKDGPGLWIDATSVLTRLCRQGLTGVWLPTPRDPFRAMPEPGRFRRRGGEIVSFPAQGDWPDEALMASRCGLHLHSPSAHARMAMGAFAAEHTWPTWLWPAENAVVA